MNEDFDKVLNNKINEIAKFIQDYLSQCFFFGYYDGR